MAVRLRRNTHFLVYDSSVYIQPVLVADMTTKGRKVGTLQPKARGDILVAAANCEVLSAEQKAMISSKLRLVR